MKGDDVVPQSYDISSLRAGLLLAVVAVLSEMFVLYFRAVFPR